ncbi:autophagy-related protein ATG7 [Acrasis kona]|uniref:Ubiquitin-like modifier-activating enzyme ATG7 n=1 Tax=Acrasis kona TaxID=1008807 RepID=A0AAW2ZST5_9EUKA
MSLVQFESFTSSVDPDYWYELENKKLTEFKLDNTERDIYATYNTGGEHEQVSSRIRLSRGAFNKQDTFNTMSVYDFSSPGTLLNSNTMEDFKNLDKKAIIKEVAKKIYDSIVSGDWINDPTLLTRFYLISYAELKQHVFYHWFAFPAITPTQALTSPTSSHLIGKTFNEEQVEQLRVAYDMYRTDNHIRDRSFFVVVHNQTSNTLTINSFSSYKEEQSSDSKVYFAFADPSSLESHPGWPLRNFSLAVSHRFPTHSVYTFLCIREIPNKRDLSRSLFIDINQATLSDPSKMVAVGWEKTLNKSRPKIADMGQMMDPIKLAESSVRLNLELMKWRMFPSLDLNKLSNTKCLLVGAGTLGCHVARNLMAWGCFNITFIDRTKVSFSNPVRQPLYEYVDCLNGGANKAQCAADHVKKIYPNANANAYSLDIPMPGHPYDDSHKEAVQSHYEQMNELIKSHDVIYLLTDTRESRWLPTLLATANDKIVINAALGFDSYLVMRHGQPNHTNRLGCYFCFDVVAPVDSTKDRTLDQQCTVTRPGVSAVAGSLAVELLVAMLHHKLESNAPASIVGSQDQGELGFIPHQIRGSMSNFQNALMTGSAYNQCTACSDAIVKEYKKNGFDFLHKVFNRSKLLEELTGLDQLQQKTQGMLDEMEFIDEDDEEYQFM